MFVYVLELIFNQDFSFKKVYDFLFKNMFIIKVYRMFIFEDVNKL